MKETWKRIPEYPNYSVSNLGNVKNSKFNKTLSPFDRRKNYDDGTAGYLTVHLCNKTDTYRYKNHSVHYLVLLAFIGKRPKDYVINHINGKRNDNRLTNLEYCTVSHNRKQDFIWGRQSFVGEKNNSAKLKESDVLNIVSLRKNKKWTYRKLAEKYSVHFTGIANIFSGHCWSYLTGIEKKY